MCTCRDAATAQGIWSSFGGRGDARGNPVDAGASERVGAVGGAEHGHGDAGTDDTGACGASDFKVWLCGCVLPLVLLLTRTYFRSCLDGYLHAGHACATLL